MLPFALTILSGAFLLFLIQPLIAKQILPWFGGSASVWTTCLVFFQCTLMAGYAYAHWTTRRLAPRTQRFVHVALLASSAAWLPILPGVGWKPNGDESPTVLILGLLAATIGLPYLLLSATSPLLQSWYARRFPASAVYRLFALSNAGSLLALVSYPTVIEPFVSTWRQSWLWSVGYVVFAAGCVATAMRGLPDRAQETVVVARPLDAPPKGSVRALWLVLSALGSLMLLAVTNHITENIASVPFLWVVPLTLYLVSFILCFDGVGWYRRAWFLGPLAIALVGMAWALHGGANPVTPGARGVLWFALGLNRSGTVVPAPYAVPLYCVGLFVCCMFCHGELAALKPSPEHLTGFYLTLSLGGALGGFAVGILAPLVFRAPYDLGLGLLVTGVLAAVVLRRMAVWVPLTALAVTGLVATNVYGYVDQLREDMRYMSRNFYGTLRVRDTGEPDTPYSTRQLLHGAIMHGEQFLAPALRRLVTSYYGPQSGVGLAIRHFEGQPLRVGVIGLGTGTMAAWGRPGDVYRFYELDPDVLQVARTQFSFLADSHAAIETVLGDARLSLEREAPQQFDVLVVDAFSSDAIPVHLLTREALTTYLRHVKPTGIVAFHVTNRYLSLAPVVDRIASERHLQAILIVRTLEEENLEPVAVPYSRTDWVLVTANEEVARDPRVVKGRRAIEQRPDWSTWTDDFSNLWTIVRWRSGATSAPDS